MRGLSSGQTISSRTGLPVEAAFVEVDREGETIPLRRRGFEIRPAVERGALRFAGFPQRGIGCVAELLLIEGSAVTRSASDGVSARRVGVAFYLERTLDHAVRRFDQNLEPVDSGRQFADCEVELVGGFAVEAAAHGTDNFAVFTAEPEFEPERRRSSRSSAGSGRV